MDVRFKIDEDLPGEIAGQLRAAGYDALSVLEQKLLGTKDEALWSIVQQESRCLITADKGFADIRLHPPGTHAGIVLFRLPRESREGYISLVRYILDQFDLASAIGAIVVVSPDSIRVHGRET